MNTTLNQSQNGQNAVLSFPVLKNSEIVQCLGELQIPFSEQDMLNPYPATVRMVYENFVELLMGIPKEEISQPQFSALSNLTYPELYEDAIPEITFMRTLGRLMRAAGIRDFSPKDLIAPDVKRLRRNLSGLINFTKFREERAVHFHQLQDATAQIIESKAKLELEVQDIQNKLQVLRAKREQEEPLIQQLQRETKELQAEIMQLNQTQAQLQSEVRNDKNTINDLKDRVASNKFTLMNVRQDCTTLRGQIVQSPEKLRKLIEDMKVSLDSERQVVLDAEQRSINLQSRHESLLRIEKEVQKGNKNLEDTESEIVKHKTSRKSLKEHKSRLDNLENKFKELTTNEQHAQRELKGWQEKSSRLAQQQGLKLEAAELAVEESRREKLDIEKQRTSTMSIVDKNANAAQDIHNRIEDLKRAHEEEMQLMKHQYIQLEEQVKDYHHNLFLAMKAL